MKAGAHLHAIWVSQSPHNQAFLLFCFYSSSLWGVSVSWWPSCCHCVFWRSRCQNIRRKGAEMSWLFALIVMVLVISDGHASWWKRSWGGGATYWLFSLGSVWMLWVLHCSVVTGRSQSVGDGVSQPMYWEKKKISYASYFDFRRRCFIFVACTHLDCHCYQSSLIWGKRK